MGGHLYLWRLHERRYAQCQPHLIEDIGTNACNLTNGVNGDIIGLDPSLGALADNGGPTQTMALLAVSPTINVGDNTRFSALVGSPNYGAGGLDQRGVTRPQPTGGTCDIGAYEYGTVSPMVTATTINGGIAQKLPLTGKTFLDRIFPIWKYSGIKTYEKEYRHAIHP